MITFRDYLLFSHERIDSAAGDFIADARRAGDLPDARSWAELRSYLVMRGACFEAIKTGRVVWRSYLAALRRS